MEGWIWDKRSCLQMTLGSSSLPVWPFLSFTFPKIYWLSWNRGHFCGWFCCFWIMHPLGKFFQVEASLSSSVGGEEERGCWGKESERQNGTVICSLCMHQCPLLLPSVLGQQNGWHRTKKTQWRNGGFPRVRVQKFLHDCPHQHKMASPWVAPLAQLHLSVCVCVCLFSRIRLCGSFFMYKMFLDFLLYPTFYFAPFVPSCFFSCFYAAIFCFLLQWCFLPFYFQRCSHPGVKSWDGSCCCATRKAGKTTLLGNYPCSHPWTPWAPWNPPFHTGEPCAGILSYQKAYNIYFLGKCCNWNNCCWEVGYREVHFLHWRQL